MMFQLAKHSFLSESIPEAWLLVNIMSDFGETEEDQYGHQYYLTFWQLNLQKLIVQPQPLHHRILLQALQEINFLSVGMKIMLHRYKS